jgi:hypothetical protein
MRTCLGGAILLLIPGFVLTPLMPNAELVLAMLIPVSMGARWSRPRGGGPPYDHA